MQKANETRSLMETTAVPVGPGGLLEGLFGRLHATPAPSQLQPGRHMSGFAGGALPTGLSAGSTGLARSVCSSPTPEQVANWVRSMPSFVVNVPGWGNVDISKVASA